jgi:hypothetical protein
VARSRRIDLRTLKRLTDVAHAHRAKFEGKWHVFSPEPIAVLFAEDTMSVDLDDGRTFKVPIAW